MKDFLIKFGESLKDGIPYPFNNILKKIKYPDYFEGSEMEKEISRWNWGAFFLNWVWGIFNKSYFALLALIPYLGIIWAFVCGLKGNEWAWENNNWKDIEQFNAVQKKWALYGAIFWGILLSIPVGMIIFVPIINYLFKHIK